MKAEMYFTVRKIFTGGLESELDFKMGFESDSSLIFKEFESTCKNFRRTRTPLEPLRQRTRILLYSLLQKSAITFFAKLCCLGYV